jgi:hypothetical protein
MGLAEIQNVLARLYTDSELRGRFIKDGLTVGRELGLDEKEAELFSQISSDELSFFSDSLVWKRLNEVEKLLPLTRKILGEQFKELFQTFAPTYNPHKIKKHLEDAIAFCDYLQKSTATDWVLDLIRLEQSRLEFNGMNRKIIVKRFRYDVFEITKKSAREETFESIRKKNWIGIWLRFKRTNQGNFYQINLQNPWLKLKGNNEHEKE